MNIAGVLVCTTADEVSAVIERLSALTGVDVHHVDPAGRLIITIEGDTIDADIERLERVKALAGVLSADMVHYHFEDGDQRPDVGDETASASPTSPVPASLADDETIPHSFYAQAKRRANS